MRFTRIASYIVMLFFIQGEKARADTIYTPEAGTQTLATINANSLDVTTIGPFNVMPPDAPAAATLAISAAFSADGNTLYTMLNTLAEVEENAGAQLATIDQTTGNITAIGQMHPFNLVAMEVDNDDTIFVTGFDLNPNPAFPGLNWFGDSTLYEIDKTTGELTEVGETNIHDGPHYGLGLRCSGNAVGDNQKQVVDR